MFDKHSFRIRVLECGLDMEEVSKSLGINVVTLYRKMNGSSDFTRKEIAKLKKILKLSFKDTFKIFFAEKLA